MQGQPPEKVSVSRSPSPVLDRGFGGFSEMPKQTEPMMLSCISQGSEGRGLGAMALCQIQSLGGEIERLVGGGGGVSARSGKIVGLRATPGRWPGPRAE